MGASIAPHVGREAAWRGMAATCTAAATGTSAVWCEGRACHVGSRDRDCLPKGDVRWQGRGGSNQATDWNAAVVFLRTRDPEARGEGGFLMVRPILTPSIHATQAPYSTALSGWSAGRSSAFSKSCASRVVCAIRHAVQADSRPRLLTAVALRPFFALP